LGGEFSVNLLGNAQHFGKMGSFVVKFDRFKFTGLSADMVKIELFHKICTIGIINEK